MKIIFDFLASIDLRRIFIRNVSYLVVVKENEWAISVFEKLLSRIWKYRNVLDLATLCTIQYVSPVNIIDKEKEPSAIRARSWVLKMAKKSATFFLYCEACDFQQDVAKILPRTPFESVEELAKEYEGKVVFAKVNTDENPDLASKHGIRGIPTLMFFKGGEVKDQVVGAVPKAQLKSKIDSFLG